jgi:starvation-inducible DNA-binding protein
LDFKIYTNALKAYESEDGERYVTGTTSSTIRDLHGDEMSLDALKTMAETARQNMTVFLNHNYNVPEDLFGSATDAQIVRRYDSETNEEVYDLDLNIRVVNEDENPEALRAYRAIKRGVKLGLSIGARVEKARRKAAEGDKPESILIEKVRLLEASVVGIPANQRSYLQNAVKSLRSGSVDISELEGVIEEEKAPASAAIEEMTLRASAIIEKLKALPVEGETAAEARPLVDSLAKLLADVATLYIKAQGAHWNVVGPDFTQYHDLFEEIYEDVYKSIDPIAENIRKLNAPAPAELREMALMASQMPVADDYDPESLASALYAANELVLRSIMNAFAEANKLNEQGIANFLAERQDMHQKWSWQLRSSLAEEEEDTGEGGIDEEDTGEESEDEETEKSAGSKIGFGDFVAWKDTDGPGGYGEVEQVVKEGAVVVPKSNEEVAAVPNDPAILVRIWAQESEGKYKPTGEFIGLLASMVKKVSGPGEGAEGAPSQTATQIPGLEILPPGTVPGGASSQEKSMDIEEKKTRVTVTVSTDSEEKQPAAASVAPSAPDAAAADSEEKLDEIKASAEDVADGEVTEKVEDEKEVVEEEPVDANVEALQELGAELVTGDAEKSIADESSVQPEVAEAVVISVETEASSFEEVESIAKSALDAANAAQEEVTGLSARVTELLESKAKVEEDLAKALDLIDRISDLGIGRKFVDRSSQKVNVKAAERAPWLSPYVQRVLEAQDEE